MIIAVDGLSGSGKSSICKAFARRNGFDYIDTGAMYRGLTYCLLEEGIRDPKEIQGFLDKSDITIEDDYVIINGKRLRQELRTARIDQQVTYYASMNPVRQWMVKKQQALGRKKDAHVIMDGRDVATVIFPDADLKIYLYATSHQRALRRWKQRPEEDFDQIHRDLLDRDAKESRFEGIPQIKADDAIEIDTTEMSFDEVLEEIERIYQCFEPSSSK